MNSACKIMRAARLCNFDRRSICVPAADPHVSEPLSIKGECYPGKTSFDIQLKHIWIIV